MLLNNWRLQISFHWPHDRFCLGFQTIKPEFDTPYWTLSIYLFIVTLDIDWG